MLQFRPSEYFSKKKERERHHRQSPEAGSPSDPHGGFWHAGPVELPPVGKRGDRRGTSPCPGVTVTRLKTRGPRTTGPLSPTFWGQKSGVEVWGGPAPAAVSRGGSFCRSQLRGGGGRSTLGLVALSLQAQPRPFYLISILSLSLSLLIRTTLLGSGPPSPARSHFNVTSQTHRDRLSLAIRSLQSLLPRTGPPKPRL